MEIIWIVASIVLSVSVYVYLMKSDDKAEDKVLTSKLFQNKAIIWSGLCFLALMALGIVFRFPKPADRILYYGKRFLLVAFLFAAAYIDYFKRIIPNKLVVMMLLIRMAVYMAEFLVYQGQFWRLLVNDATALLIPLSFFIVGTFLVKNGIGMGDVKLMIVQSLYLGLQGALSALFFSLLVAFVMALFLLFIKKKGKKDSLPFAPAVWLGTIVSLSFGG